MTSDHSFAKLLDRLRAGDDRSATEIFQRFAHRLIGLARMRLGGIPARKTDPEDVVQSVFGSFFTRCADGQFTLANWDSLWALLTVITLRKCSQRVDYYTAACRDVRREAGGLSEGQTEVPEWQGLARDPTPEEAVQLTELVEGLLRGLTDRDRQIVQLTLQECSAAEISLEVGCTERTVQRVLQTARGKLQRLLEADG